MLFTSTCTTVAGKRVDVIITGSPLKLSAYEHESQQKYNSL
jgi:hypothetical protein